MTQQEALAQALADIWPKHQEGSGGTGSTVQRSWNVYDPARPSDFQAFAAAILAALPEGWVVARVADDGQCAWCSKYLASREVAREHMKHCRDHPAAQQERERLRALFSTFSAGYMHSNASVLKRLADPEDDR